MANYVDLYSAARTPTLDKQILMALTIKANVLAKLGGATLAQKNFATAALRNPESYLELVRNYIYAEYNASAVEVITNASDTQVQMAVNAAVDTLLSI